MCVKAPITTADNYEVSFISISVSVQSLSRVWLFETLGTAARQASLLITNSWSLLKLTDIENKFMVTKGER